ncbi:MAG: hypothetical protein FWC00_04825 [Firmicutes bacterium]|nr:hypothetical protein [Bacillota bacterium]
MFIRKIGIKDNSEPPRDYTPEEVRECKEHLATYAEQIKLGKIGAPQMTMRCKANFTSFFLRLEKRLPDYGLFGAFDSNQETNPVQNYPNFRIIKSFVWPMLSLVYLTPELKKTEIEAPEYFDRCLQGIVSTSGHKHLFRCSDVHEGSHIPPKQVKLFQKSKQGFNRAVLDFIDFYPMIWYEGAEAKKVPYCTAIDVGAMATKTIHKRPHSKDRLRHYEKISDAMACVTSEILKGELPERPKMLLKTPRRVTDDGPGLAG